MTYFARNQGSDDRTPKDLRIASPEVAEPPAEPVSHAAWSEDYPTPFSLAVVVVGLLLSALGMAAVGYELVTRLTSTR